MLDLFCHKGPIVHIIYSYNTLFNLDAALLPPAGRCVNISLIAGKLL